MEYDFSGWATRNDLRCSDGRIIRRDAFKDNDGMKVPLVWNHQHNNPNEVLGHALLENRDEGVYAYCTFNETNDAKTAKLLIQHGDITQLSIYANKLRQQGSNVIHGAIREVSLVLAGANPGAFIDSVLVHGEASDEEAVIYTGEDIILEHSGCGDFSFDEDKDSLEHSTESEEDSSMDNEETVQDVFDTLDEKQKNVVYYMIGKALDDAGVQHSDEDEGDNHIEHADDGYGEGSGEETVQDVFDTLSEKQKNVVYFIIGQALENAGVNETKTPEGGNNMKHNVFDTEETTEAGTLCHSDEVNIISLAKSNSVGSLRDAIEMYVEDNQHLAHGFVDAVSSSDAIDQLFPDHKDVRPGAPEFIERDQGWVSTVMAGVHKSPISRIRTRQADITGTDLRAYGYKKGSEKKLSGNIKLLKRTTDPTTVYRKDALHRDDIIDITDFDVVEYQYYVMKQNLNEELATAFMIGDGREEGDRDKIDETKIRPIWTDDELYTIHRDVNIEAARTELQGTDTNKHFSENYIYAEAIIAAALYAREKYKGSGNLTFFCTPHLLNVMLLARDYNGRRIYESKTDLAAALNVTSIQTAEQFEGKIRVDKQTKKHKLLGIFVNLSDYHVGSTKGGEITRFSQFDIDFNQEKYLIETRLSGALTRVKSAIVLEEPVSEPSSSSEVVSG